MRDADAYRMKPALVVRLVGGPVVLLGVLVIVAGLVAALAGWPPLTVLLVALVGVLALAGWAAWLRRAPLVRLDAGGYRVRFLRDVGPRTGAWSDVREAVAASPGDVPCVILHRHDGRDTVVPVRALDADPDDFARAVIARLEAAARDSRAPGGAL